MTNILTGRKFLFEANTDFGAKGWGAGITVDQEDTALQGPDGGAKVDRRRRLANTPFLVG